MRDRILHLGDLHLGDRHTYLQHRASARRAETDGVLDRIAERVLDPASRIGGVLIAGDLFEHFDPEPVLVERVIRTLRKLDTAGIRILTVPGNHDEFSYPESVYRRKSEEWPGTLVTNPVPRRVDTWTLERTVVDLYSMAFVAGQSQPPYDSFEVEPNDHVKIAVLHGTLDLDATDRSLPLRSEQLSTIGLDYVALGHLHRPMERRLGKGWIAYPGRIEGGGFTDPGGADLLEVGFRDGRTEWSRTPFPHRSIETQVWNLSTVESEEEIIRRLERESNRESARILLVSFAGVCGFPLEVPRLQEEWGSRFFYLELRAGVTAVDPDLEVLAAEPTIRGEFVRQARRQLENARTEEERARCLAALRFGLAAFEENRPMGIAQEARV